jgi:large subunit ribosomal protein L25
MATKNRPQLKAEPRTITGRKVKTLRRQGILPANVFGKKIKSLSLQLALQDFTKIADAVGETGLVDLSVQGEDKPRPVLITNVHLDPVTNHPLHADFHQVDLTEPVTANIPVELTGESPAVKEKSAVLITLLDEIEVEALPADLPEKFAVDISGLKEFNDSVLVKDLKVDTASVTIKADPEAQIVMVQEPKEEEVAPPPPADVSAETPVEAEAPVPEGEPKPEEPKAEPTAEPK